MYKLGIDVGTSSVKCVLFGKGLDALASTSGEYKFTQSDGAKVTQNANDWWRETARCIKEVVIEAGINGEEIKAIAISGQCPSFLLVDKEGNPIGDCSIWMDRSTEEQYPNVRSKISEERLHEITGNYLDALYYPTRFLAAKQDNPSILEKAHKVLNTNSYINYKLTGVYSFDKASAATTLFYDIADDCWSQEVCDALDVDINIFPTLYGCMDVIGTTTEEVAHELGIGQGIPVLGGTIDIMSATIEAGVIASGQLIDATGTSSVITCVTEAENAKGLQGLVTITGVMDGTVALGSPISNAGGSYKWLKEKILDVEGNEYYSQMEQMINQNASDPTKLIFLPYLSGERAPIWDGNARGVFFGLNLSTDQSEMMRAVMEGTSYASKHNLESLRMQGVNCDQEKIISVGGCCNSEMWLKIKASILNMPIHIPKVNFGSPAGCALMTMPITGEYPSIEAAVEDLIVMEKVIYPVEEWVEHYEQMYEIYKKLYVDNKQSFDMLAEIK